MKKTLIFLGLFFSVGIVLVFVWAITNKRPNNPSIKTLVQSVLQNARPLSWLDDRYVLVGQGNRIVKYDTSNLKIVDIISDSYHSGSYECFSPEGGVFAIKEPIVSNYGNSGRVTSYENIIHRWIQDWNQPTLFKELKTVEWWNTNPHDCTHFDYKEASSTEKIGDDVFNYDRNTPKLVKTMGGNTKSYYRFQKPYFERVVLMEKSGGVKKINLGKTQSIGERIDASFDKKLQQYFWYEVKDDFNSDNNSWPLKGWWVTPNGEILHEITIPKGPWVKHFSTLYQFKYFSCGPSCYSNMKMYAENGRIYIYIWGEAIDDSVSGIYRLDVQEQKWDKLIAGVVDSHHLTISPNGCQISYAIDSEMQIMNVCEK